MQANHIIAYLLLVGGLVLALLAVWQSYLIFTGSAEPPSLFVPATASSPSSQAAPANLQAALQQQISVEIANQVSRTIPANSVSKLLNLIAWSVFAGMLIVAGTRIAGLGARLLL